MRENGGFPPKGKAGKGKLSPSTESGGLFQTPILQATAAGDTEDEFSIGQLAGGSGFDDEQRQKINHLIAKLVHGCGIPAETVEDKAFLDLMKELNYGYYCTGVPSEHLELPCSFVPSLPFAQVPPASLPNAAKISDDGLMIAGKQWIETFGLKGVYQELKAQTIMSPPKKTPSKKRKGVPDDA